jgi:hypothetical protein
LFNVGGVAVDDRFDRYSSDRHGTAAHLGEEQTFRVLIQPSAVLIQTNSG